MHITQNEMKFICWGTLMTVYLVSAGLMGIASRDLVLAPSLGNQAALVISSAALISVLYLLIWYFMCRTKIPRRNWSLGITGLIWAVSQLWVQSLSRNVDLFSAKSTNITMILVVASLIVAPFLLRIPAGRIKH